MMSNNYRAKVDIFGKWNLIITELIQGVVNPDYSCEAAYRLLSGLEFVHIKIFFPGVNNIHQHMVIVQFAVNLGHAAAGEHIAAATQTDAVSLYPGKRPYIMYGASGGFYFGFYP
jgi:hypothetical protein